MKVLSVFLCVLLAFSASLQAVPLPGQGTTDHLVAIEELHKQISERAATRTQNIQEVQALLRHEAVQSHMGQLLNLEKLAIAIPALDDSTLEQLARESQRMNEEFQAGVANPGLTFGVLAGLAVFTILILVHTYDRGEP